MGVFQALKFTVHVLGDDEGAGRRRWIELCRSTAASTLGEYARARAKHRWAEKSLPTLEFATDLVEIFPDARFVCVFREATDFIMSAEEASSWGFGNYGFAPYIHGSPDNFVAALASYWADKTDALTRVEHDHPGRTIRVRYEDLVTTPAFEVERLLRFVDLEWDERCVDPMVIFPDRPQDGPGDHKIRYTTGFSTASIGRGWRVPVEMIPPDLRSRVDTLARELGYAELEADVSDPANNLSRRLDRRPSASPRLKSQLDEALRVGAFSAEMRVLPALQLVLPDEQVVWTVDFEHGRVLTEPLDAPCILMADVETLSAIADGSCNPAVALRESRLRVATEKLPVEQAMASVDQLFALLRQTLAAGDVHDAA